MPWVNKYYFRPGLLLTRLHLPALRTLALSSIQMDHEHIPDIHTLLQSTPSLTTLTIKGYDAFAAGARRMSETHAAVLGRLTPIWANTPHLTHAELTLPKTSLCSPAERASLFDGFLRHAFFGASSLWAIDDLRCPLRTMTLIDTESAMTLQFNEVEKLTRDRIQLCGGGPSNIVFKFVSKVDDVLFEEPEAPLWKFSRLWDLK
ncbi:hypothetical protein BJ912DRAFT_101724 [Pholiota molesta]|nr:hypothetical protein BJ912DRAFT_101724 [Pholiota molesta]